MKAGTHRSRVRVRSPGLLRVRCFKSRFSEERTINIAADFSTGRFERNDPGDNVQHMQLADLLQQIISQSPGCTANEIVRRSSTGRQRVLGQLNTGIKKRLWRMEQGSRNSKLYYAISKPPVSALVREVPTKPLTGTSRVTSSAID